MLVIKQYVHIHNYFWSYITSVLSATTQRETCPERVSICTHLWVVEVRQALCSEAFWQLALDDHVLNFVPQQFVVNVTRHWSLIDSKCLKSTLHPGWWRWQNSLYSKNANTSICINAGLFNLLYSQTWWKIKCYIWNFISNRKVWLQLKYYFKSLWQETCERTPWIIQFNKLWWTCIMHLYSYSQSSEISQAGAVGIETKQCNSKGSASKKNPIVYLARSTDWVHVFSCMTKVERIRQNG